MSNIKKFISNKQRRFENNIQAATTNDNREIIVEGWNNEYPPSSNIIISVNPSMRPKLANFVEWLLVYLFIYMKSTITIHLRFGDGQKLRKW